MVDHSETRRRTGNLVSAIQKEWGRWVGMDESRELEQLLAKSHDLLNCHDEVQLRAALGPDGLRGFFGVESMIRFPRFGEIVASFDRETRTPHPLVTDRLTLRDLTEADFVSTYAMDCDPLVMRYIGTGEPETRPFDEYRAFITQRLGLWLSDRFHMWAMRLHGSDEFLGWVMLKPIRDTPHVEVGYRMPQTSWGHGYATEATRAVLDYGFNTIGLEEITAVTHPDNAASQHVLTKSGLRRDGTLNYYGGGEIPFFRLRKEDYRT